MSDSKIAVSAPTLTVLPAAALITSEPDIYRAARVIIRKCGEDAPIEAAVRARPHAC